jgi:hypothetical protein
MTLLRRSRIQNSTVSKYKAAKKEFEEQKRFYDRAYADLIRAANIVLKQYVPLKNQVSDVDWSQKKIVRVKLVHNSKYVELTMSHNESLKESFWKFPAWMIEADRDRTIEGLKQQIAEQGKKYKSENGDRKSPPISCIVYD